MIDIERHINLFQTAAEKQAAIESESLNYPNLSYVEETGSVDLAETAPPVDYSKKYFTIVSLADENDITIVTDNVNVNAIIISASTDNGETWTEYSLGSGSEAIIGQLNNGDKLIVKGRNSGYLNRHFMSSKSFKLQGNIMSLISGDSFTSATSIYGSAFKNLFLNSTNLISAENLVLPATTMTNQCYYHMFEGCTNLTTAPALPATTLADSCYGSMFYKCTNLTTAPELPAATLAGYCYWGMFYNCTSLNYIKMLATNVSATACLDNWANNVAASGTFVKKSGVTIPSGNNGIPNNWTVIEV